MGTSSAGPGISLILFTITTIFYFIVRVMYGKDVYETDNMGNTLKDEKGNPKILYTAESIKRKIYMIYFLIVVIGQLIVNLALLRSMCNTSISSVAFAGLIYTLVPWILIFGVLKVMFVMLPGWKAPFSNTFGYLFAKIIGLNWTMRAILKPLNLEEDNVVLEGEQLKSFQTLRHIYKDDSVLINEITPLNFDNFWKTMEKSQLIKTEYEIKNDPKLKGKNIDKLKGDLQWYVGFKDDISEFIWFLLSGSLISSIVYNNMNKYQCVYSASEIQEQDKKYKESVEEKEKEEGMGKKQIYSSDE
jgi:hypothetical protein